MNYKKWSIYVITAYVIILIGIGGFVLILDPYFHYHAPISGISYDLNLDSAEYVNDGISKNFTYDAMLTGTSVTRGFQMEEADYLFNRNFIRVSYSGEGFKKINDNLKMAINANPNLKLVIRGLDTMWLIADKDWLGYEEYPEYLYDDNILNDVNYLYNKEILLNDVIPEILRTLKGEPESKFDDYIDTSSGGKEMVFSHYKRPEKEIKEITQSETDEYFEMMDQSLEKNVISTIEENPDIAFYIFFPPYSICWWDNLNQAGSDVLNRRIDMEEYTIKKLLEYDNVRLFSFFNNYDIICNLDNYIDEVHYTDDICSQILIWMNEGKYELTKNNYEDYIQEITYFYNNYDYDSIYE